MGRIKSKITRIISSKLPEQEIVLSDYEVIRRYNSIYQNFNNISFSQEGEDLVLDRFLGNHPKGFFVDIGAHHPIRFSNTYKFYLKGWRGINIDAMPESMRLFEKVRPLDINIEAAISDQEEVLTYYIFNEPALNTLSGKEAALKDGINGYKIIDQKQLKTQTLESILDAYLPNDVEIDFMSIDVEGLDIAVIKSNNWEKYHPKYLLTESLRENMDDLKNNSVYLLLKEIGYSFVAKTYNTMFFRYDNE